MSDQRLRELERRYRESGSPTDQAEWLLERVRVGDLEPSRLSAAARSGHPGAVLAVPAAEVERAAAKAAAYVAGMYPAGVDRAASSWVFSLMECGRRVFTRALFEAVRTLGGTALPARDGGIFAEVVSDIESLLSAKGDSRSEQLQRVLDRLHVLRAERPGHDVAFGIAERLVCAMADSAPDLYYRRDLNAALEELDSLVNAVPASVAAMRLSLASWCLGEPQSGVTRP